MERPHRCQRPCTQCGRRIECDSGWGLAAARPRLPRSRLPPVLLPTTDSSQSTASLINHILQAETAVSAAPDRGQAVANQAKISILPLAEAARLSMGVCTRVLTSRGRTCH